MSAAALPRLLPAFPSLPDAAYSVAGFILDDRQYVYLLLGYKHEVEEGPHRSFTKTGYQRLTLPQVEAIGLGFFAEHKSDAKIFSAAPEAVARQKSLGYICYQMLRRLKRLEEKAVAYEHGPALMHHELADAIRNAINGNVDKNGFVVSDYFAGLRAAEFPKAMPHEVAAALPSSTPSAQPA